MSPWKILVADGLESAGLALLQTFAEVKDGRQLTPEELQAALSACEALIVRSRTRVTAELMAQAPQLRVIGRAGVGVDNIDLEAARQRGITVVNTPAATTQAVVELTLGLILALARFIPQADASMKAGAWRKNELLGIEIAGKTLGVIGMGNIGAGVAQRAAALGMSVNAYDPHLTSEAIQQRGALPASLEEIWAQSDFISLHVPLTETTRNLINAETIQQMKPGVRLVCTARGGIIDEQALLAGLESGRIAGAALDVFAQEPPGSTPLVRHPNVIATPHIGAQSREAQERAAREIAQEVRAALTGQPLRWKVV